MLSKVTQEGSYNRCRKSIVDMQLSVTSWSWDKKAENFRFIVCFLTKCLLLLWSVDGPQPPILIVLVKRKNGNSTETVIVFLLSFQ